MSGKGKAGGRGGGKGSANGSSVDPATVDRAGNTSSAPPAVVGPAAAEAGAEDNRPSDGDSVAAAGGEGGSGKGPSAGGEKEDDPVSSSSLFAFGGDPVYSSIFAQDFGAGGGMGMGGMGNGAPPQQGMGGLGASGSDHFQAYAAELAAAGADPHVIAQQLEGMHLQQQQMGGFTPEQMGNDKVVKQGSMQELYAQRLGELSQSPNAQTALESADFIWRADEVTSKSVEYPFSTPPLASGGRQEGFTPQFDSQFGDDATLVDSHGRQVCRYFLQGHCTRGRSCNFSHNSPAQPEETGARSGGQEQGAWNSTEWGKPRREANEAPAAPPSAGQQQGAPFFMPQMGYDPAQMMQMAAAANVPPHMFQAMMAQQQQQHAMMAANAMMPFMPGMPGPTTPGVPAMGAAQAPASPEVSASGQKDKNDSSGSPPTSPVQDASEAGKSASTWAAIAGKGAAATNNKSTTKSDKPASPPAESSGTEAPAETAADADTAVDAPSPAGAPVMPGFNPGVFDPRVQAYYAQMGMNPQMMMNPQLMMAYMAAAQQQVQQAGGNAGDPQSEDAAQKMAAAMMMNPMLNPAMLAQLASFNGMMYPGMQNQSGDNKNSGDRADNRDGGDNWYQRDGPQHGRRGHHGNRGRYNNDGWNQDGDYQNSGHYGGGYHGHNRGNGRRHDRHDRHGGGYGQNTNLHLRSTPPPPPGANDPIPVDLHTIEDVRMLEGKIYAVCKDQQGCRYLQKKLEESETSRDVIFNEVFEYAAELMTDPFGNYLCQKLLEHCTDAQRTQVVRRVSPDLVVVSRNMHGTRAVQKLIETLTTPEQIGIIRGALGHAVVELIQDLNGNHVIQRCLNRLSPDDNQFIFDAVTTSNHCVAVATHRHGCCVLQRCIDHASEPQKVQLIREITKNSLQLVQDPYGNYVVQYVLELPFPDLVEALIRSFLGHIRQLSMQKFSSNVVEKCIQLATAETRRLMILEILAEENFAAMLQDPFANYVVQTGLSSAEPNQYQELVENIRPHLNLLRNTPFGKRIQSKFMKDGLLKDLIAGNMPGTSVTQAATHNGNNPAGSQHQNNRRGHGGRGGPRSGQHGGTGVGNVQNASFPRVNLDGPTPAEARKMP